VEKKFLVIVNDTHDSKGITRHVVDVTDANVSENVLDDVIVSAVLARKGRRDVTHVERAKLWLKYRKAYHTTLYFQVTSADVDESIDDPTSWQQMERLATQLQQLRRAQTKLRGLLEPVAEEADFERLKVLAEVPKPVKAALDHHRLLLSYYAGMEALVLHRGRSLYELTQQRYREADTHFDDVSPFGPPRPAAEDIEEDG